MTGQWLIKNERHICKKPELTQTIDNGSQWQCDCGQIWEVLGLYGWLSLEQITSMKTPSIELSKKWWQR